MNVAALYDIHGNLPALEAVLAEVPDEAAIVIGGDVFSGPMPSETLSRVRGLGPRVRFVRGNADRDLGPYEERWRARYEWLLAQLTADEWAAAEAIRATSYPDPEEKIELLMNPHTAEEAAEVLEQRALEEAR